MANLPALPGSDDTSLNRNMFSGYYGVRARDFWGPNAITQEVVKPLERCDHRFVGAEGGAQCSKCHFGLLGQFEISNGKLLFRGEPIAI